MMETVKLVFTAIVIVICIITFYLTIKSHIRLHKRASDTLGKKMYRITIILFSISGILFTYAWTTFCLLLSSTLIERLITYKRCYGNKTWLGKFLVKINF